jgi:ABC-type bacteriocin/lantibiotic exporter with double-glycine peptidase domain
MRILAKDRYLLSYCLLVELVVVAGYFPNGGCARPARAAPPASRAASRQNVRLTKSPRRPLPADCGARALAIVCENLGILADPAALAKSCGLNERGTSLAALAKAARSLGLRADGIQVDLAALNALSSPDVVWVDGNHYVALLEVSGGKATIRDPNRSGEEAVAAEELLRRSGGVLLRLER